jgi:glycosyltransferase involved in cell wall biosynthesis
LEHPEHILSFAGYVGTVEPPRVALLCDRVGDAGGVERYWETVAPALDAAGVPLRIYARDVAQHHQFGARATEIAWGGDGEPASRHAAVHVLAALRRGNIRTVITAGVFDREVLAAVREQATRWVVRIHDHRMFCPNGDRVYPQFSGICEQAMGRGCIAGALLHGCMHGPRRASLDRLANRMAVRDLIAQADVAIVSSEHMLRTAVKNGLRPERLVITPPPLPDDAFAVPAPPPETPVLLFSARLTPQKGLLSLIRALARIEHAARPRLIVAGSGEAEERRARALAQRRGVAVEWRGWLSAPELRTILDQVTAVAVPSLWPEPFGLVGTEAQARGRPAVAYDVGGIGEWLRDGGIAVPRGDEAALARAILEIVNPAGWAGYAAAARRNAERYRLRGHLSTLGAILGPGATRLHPAV